MCSSPSAVRESSSIHHFKDISKADIVDALDHKSARDRVIRQAIFGVLLRRAPEIALAFAEDYG